MLWCNMGVLLLIFLARCTAIQDTLIITTRKGQVRGETQWSALGKRVDVWASIPYATPPLGALRFRHPRPIEPWTGVKDVTGKANSCVQIEGVSLPGFAGEQVWLYNTPISEDCLYLQVAVPGGVPDSRSKKLPVMVWIYGGGYYSGTYTLDLYDPKILATEFDVVVVSIQYRVASLGFLYLDTEDVPGNAGMYDQVMALRWIKDNIDNFGGDPHSITLFSESAGSASVAYHLLSPLSGPLFTRAILQSASALNPCCLLKLEEAKKRSLHLAELMGCPHKDNNLKTTIECMRGANATRMVNREWDGLTSGIIELPFTPIVDGNFLPDGPKRLLSKGQFKKTQILLGANKDEGIYFIMYYLMDIFKFNATRINVTREVFDQSVIELNKYVKPVGQSAISFTYTNWTDPDNWLNNVKALDGMVGDYHFTCPVVDFAQYYSDQRDNSVFLYYFNHFSSSSPWPHWSGVMHGDEIAYIFGDPFRKNKNYTDEERKLSRDMMTYWTNFAKTGQPSLFTNGSWSDVYWPVHSPNLKEYLELRATEPHRKGNGLKAKECAFWRTYLPQLLQNVNSPPGVSSCQPVSPCCPPSSPSPDCPCSTSSTSPASSSLAALITGHLFTLASLLLLALVL